MPNRTAPISNNDELKSGSATMEMVLFGLMSGDHSPKILGFLDLGLTICDIITKGPSLTASAVANYRDFAKAEAFKALDRKQRAYPDRIAGLEDDAPVVKEVLERLKIGKNVTEHELDVSASFFSRIYCAM